MSAFLISVIILLYALQSFLTRKYTDHYPGDPDNASTVFSVVYGAVVAVVSLCFSGFKLEISWLTLLLAVINALVLTGYNTAIVKASQNGSHSVIMVFCLAGGISIPTVAAMLFGDEVSIGKIISILVLIPAVYMVSKKKTAEASAPNKRTVFILYCFLLAFTNGAYGMLLDTQQRLTGIEEKEEMVALTFIGCTLICAVTLAIKEKKGFLPAFRQNPVSLAFLLSCSVVAALAVNVLVILLDMIDTAVLYTFDNAGVLLLSVIFSAIFLKERLSKLNIVGCIIMGAALICVSVL